MLFPLLVACQHALASAGNSTYPAGSYGARGKASNTAQGTVLIATLDGRVYALDAWTGEHKWTFESGGPLISSSSSAVLTSKEEGEEDYQESEVDEEGNPNNPVDCKVTPWLPWNRCTKQCDRGTQMRLRKIQQRARYGGMGCPPLSIVRSCSTRDCKKGENPAADNADPNSRSISRRDDGVSIFCTLSSFLQRRSLVMCCIFADF